MKKFIIFLLFPFSVFAQEGLVFSQIFEAKGNPVEDIYSTLRIWLSKQYRTSESVFEVEDVSNGKIVVSSKFRYENKKSVRCHRGWISYSLAVDIKDGKFRVSISDIVHESYDGPQSSCSFGLITTSDKARETGLLISDLNRQYVKCKEFLDEYFGELLDSFEDIMKESNNSGASDDW